MKNLPDDIILKIYEYDGRYKKCYGKVLEQLEIIMNWFSVKQTILRDSIPLHYASILEFPSDDKEYYIKIEKEEFPDFYFYRFRENSV